MARLYTTTEIQALTAETIQEIPDALLVGILKRLRSTGTKAPFSMIVLAECKRRGKDRIRAWWIVQQMAPDPCACGGPGLYIVGSTTYCRKCRPAAMAHLATTAGHTYEQKSAKRELFFRDVERGQRQNDRLLAYEKSLKITRKVKK